MSQITSPYVRRCAQENGWNNYQWWRTISKTTAGRLLSDWSRLTLKMTDGWLKYSHLRVLMIRCSLLTFNNKKKLYIHKSWLVTFEFNGKQIVSYLSDVNKPNLTSAMNSLCTKPAPITEKKPVQNNSTQNQARYKSLVLFYLKPSFPKLSIFQ